MKQEQDSPVKVKELNDKHKDNFGTSREPLLNGIASDYDLDLFRRAQVGFTAYIYSPYLIPKSLINQLLEMCTSILYTLGCTEFGSLFSN